MDVILFLREIRKKGKKYKDIWIEILLQYDGKQNCNIKLNVPIGMPPSSFYRIINHGVELFPKYIKSCYLTKNKMTLTISNEFSTLITEPKPIKKTIPIKNKLKETIIPEIIPIESEPEKQENTLITEVGQNTEFFPEVVVTTKKKRLKKEVVVLPVHIEIISYLNECAGTKYQFETKTTLDLINGLLEQNFTTEDLKHVIEVKSIKWLNTKYQDFLRPETLFGKKFESYLNEKKINNEKQHKTYESVSEATELGWKR
jgi:uncharacterized phage protein (TIGR02220 family)